MGLRSAFVVLSCVTALSFGTLGCGSEPERRCTFDEPMYSVEAVRTFSSTSTTDALLITTCLGESCEAVRGSAVLVSPEPDRDHANVRLVKGAGDLYELTTTFRLKEGSPSVTRVSVRVRDGAKTLVEVTGNLSWTTTYDQGCHHRPTPETL